MTDNPRTKLGAEPCGHSVEAEGSYIRGCNHGDERMKKADCSWAPQPASVKKRPRVCITTLPSCRGRTTTSSARRHSTAKSVACQQQGAGIVASASFRSQNEPSQKWSRVKNSPVVVASGKPGAVRDDGRREFEARNGFSRHRAGFPGNGQVVDPAHAAYVPVHQECGSQNPA